MSESEKKKRQGYRKNREKWIFAQSVIVAVITIAVLISALVSIQLNKAYYIGYKESGYIDYKVFLKENEFYGSSYLGKDQSYVASLIDNIITDFNYEIELEADDVNYEYSYSIKSYLEVLDDSSKAPIYNPEQTLVEVNDARQNSSNRLSINEILVINYDEYNDLANRFIEAYGLTNTTNNIVIKLEVDVLSDCKAFVGGNAADTYYSELRIPLTTQTVNVKMTSTVPAAETRMIACTRGIGSEVFKTTAIVLGVIDIFAVLFLIVFIYLTRTPDITYTARVKKILSQYKSYIQKINNLFETHGYQVIFVDTFDEMLEIRDTIQAPILMYENEDKTCTKFMIPTDSKLLYLYEIKVDGYVDPPVEPKEDTAYTTVVKPNITNVVRPVVKVVVTPPAPPAPKEPEIQTVVEDAELEVEAEDEIPEVVATVEECETEEIIEEPVEEAIEEAVEETVEEAVEETVEEAVEETVEEAVEEPIEEPTEEIVEEVVEETVEEIVEEVIEEPSEEAVEEILASIPEAEEDDTNTVEAIDVFWKERADKMYRYDPDGNVVEAGDIVLVPTRDVAQDKDLVREAEVAKGNYKIDSETLEKPLKKIIGVVKRRAEKALIALITPDDDTIDNQ